MGEEVWKLGRWEVYRLWFKIQQGAEKVSIWRHCEDVYEGACKGAHRPDDFTIPCRCNTLLRTRSNPSWSFSLRSPTPHPCLGALFVVRK